MKTQFDFKNKNKNPVNYYNYNYCYSFLKLVDKLSAGEYYFCSAQ